MQPPPVSMAETKNITISVLYFCKFLLLPFVENYDFDVSAGSFPCRQESSLQ
jgi:hypothetical protein